MLAPVLCCLVCCVVSACVCVRVAHCHIWRVSVATVSFGLLFRVSCVVQCVGQGRPYAYRVVRQGHAVFDVSLRRSELCLVCRGVLLFCLGVLFGWMLFGGDC